MTSTTHKIKENRYESLKTRNRTSPTKPLDSNTRFYQKSDYEHIQDCKEHMMRNGFDYRGEIKVNTNGKFKRFSIDENKTKKDEFYMSLNGISSKGNTFFYCTYGSWKSGEKYTYKSWENSKDRNSINKLSEEEIKAIEKQHKEDIEKANEKKKKEQAQVAEHAKNIWGQSKDQAQTTEHLYYLEKKGVKNYGLRFGYYPKGNEKYPVLVVPIKNINGEIRTLQYIFKDENDEIQKRFLKNGEKTGNYYVIGEIKHNELFYVCEGYATAASVYEAIQKPVVVALDSNNLNLVIENLRSIYPKNEIIIAADKDKNEVGQNKAKEAASKYNCKVILPNFKEKAIDEKNTDFNDLHTAFGLEEVKRQLIDESEYDFKEKKSIRYGDYIVDPSGLYHYPEEDDAKQTWLSDPIYPIAHLRDKEGKNHTILYEIYDGERKHQIALTRRTINKISEFIEILYDYGQKVSIKLNDQKSLQTFLMKTFPKELMRCVDKSGWHEDQYIFPDGEVLGASKDKNERVYPLNEASPKGVEQKGSLQEWQDNILKICANNSRLIFSIGAALCAPCLRLVGDEGVVFNLKGSSSIGKTRCLMIGGSVYGSPDFKRSWRTTANGLEGICCLHNDCLLPLDEFGQSDAKEVEAISYMYSQGVGKQRASKDGSPKEPKTWNGICLSTGEVGIADHIQDEKSKLKAGQLVRVIDIPAKVEEAFGCFEELHGFENGEVFADHIKELVNDYYGTIGREYIKAIINNSIEKSRKYLKFTRDDFASDVARDYDGQVKRVANRFGLVLASLNLGIDLGLLSKYLSKEMTEKAIKKCFLDWLDDRGTTESFESDSIVKHTVGIINRNSDSKFIFTNNVDEKVIRQDLWGYKNGSKFYLFTYIFDQVIVKGYNKKTVISTLKESGVLIPGKDRTTQPTRIEAHFKETERFYVLDLGKQKNDDKEDVTC